VGTPFSSNALNKLTKELYLSDRFHNISVHTTHIKNNRINLTFIFQVAKRIESIVFEGNSALSDIFLLRSISSSKDRAFDESKLLSDKLAIEEHYKDEGFFNAKIQLQFFSPQESHRITVTFKIKENAPAKISEFILDSDGRPKAKHLQHFFEDTKIGNLYKPPTLRQEILEIKKHLLKKNRLSSQILPERITFNKSKSEVKIYLKIIPGPEYSFIFQGQTEFDSSEFLTPLQMYEEAAPTVTLDDITKQIIRLFKNEGYFNVGATYKTEKRNSVL